MELGHCIDFADGLASACYEGSTTCVHSVSDIPPLYIVTLMSGVGKNGFYVGASFPDLIILRQLALSLGGI